MAVAGASAPAGTAHRDLGRDRIGQGVVALALFWAGGLITKDVGVAFLVGVPAIVAGTLLGERLSIRVHGHAFRVAVLALLGLSGALAIVGALTP